jgi:general secretion pathway protein A
LYEQFFGFTVKPFELLPDPEFLFPSRSHKRALTYLEFGIRERSGFILLTGEIGSGKTTIISNLLKQKSEDVVVSKVFNTKVDAVQLLALINEDFGLPVDGRDKVTMLRDLNHFLVRQYAAGKQPVIVIDEAQNLSAGLLEEIRLLSNLESGKAKLLQIILVGQPELRRTLAAESLLQLRQRISVNCQIHPLSREETEQYILHRMERAGNRTAVIFPPDGLDLIAQKSRGIPRLINIICDYLLLTAYAAQTREIYGPMVMEILEDLNFEQQYWDIKAPQPVPAGKRGDAAGVGEVDLPDRQGAQGLSSPARGRCRGHGHDLLRPGAGRPAGGAAQGVGRPAGRVGAVHLRARGQAGPDRGEALRYSRRAH